MTVQANVTYTFPEEAVRKLVQEHVARSYGVTVDLSKIRIDISVSPNDRYGGDHKSMQVVVDASAAQPAGAGYHGPG